MTYCWVLHQIEHYGFISGKLWGYPTLQNRRAYKIHLIKHIYHIWPALLKYPNQLYMGAACKLSVSLFSPDSAAGFVCVFFFFSFCWFDRKADSVRLNNALHHQVYQFVFWLLQQLDQASVCAKCWPFLQDNRSLTILIKSYHPSFFFHQELKQHLKKIHPLFHYTIQNCSGRVKLYFPSRFNFLTVVHHNVCVKCWISVDLIVRNFCSILHAFPLILLQWLWQIHHIFVTTSLLP